MTIDVNRMEARYVALAEAVKLAASGEMGASTSTERDIVFIARVFEEYLCEETKNPAAESDGA